MELKETLAQQIIDSYARYKNRQFSVKTNRVFNVGHRLSPTIVKANYPKGIINYIESSKEHKVLTLKGALDIQSALKDFTEKEFETLCGRYKKYSDDAVKQKLLTAFKELKKYYAAICQESYEMANIEGAEKYGKIVLAHRDNKIIGVYYLPA
ncbi:MAG: hypothetical protein U0K71_07525 [Paludibacteraceae bacterium]|nr:hypothetical protein [Paludibacteraceae bacterium]